MAKGKAFKMLQEPFTKRFNERRLVVPLLFQYGSSFFSLAIGLLWVFVRIRGVLLHVAESSLHQDITPSKWNGGTNCISPVARPSQGSHAVFHQFKPSNTIQIRHLLSILIIDNEASAFDYWLGIIPVLSMFNSTLSLVVDSWVEVGKMKEMLKSFYGK